MLNLDINKELAGNHIVHGRIGDNNCRTEKVSVINGDGTPFDLTGITISFTGNTHEFKTKVFDTKGVHDIDPKKGVFHYTFPSEAFSVAGSYERAYFSFSDKNGTVASTGDFEILVLANTDLTAPEAETIITEYNKLVEELHKLQKKNIAELKEQQDEFILELAQAFAKLQNDVTALEGKITAYETNVTKVASAAEKTISDVLTEALEAIREALEEFQKGNFYTKPESDERFAKKTDLTKENVSLGNVDNYATATQTDAEQGLAGNKFITPMGVKQHVDKRMATQEEVTDGEAVDKLISPKGLADTIKFMEVFLPGSSLSNVAIEGTLAPHGNTAGGSLNYIKNRPYTVNSDGTFTFKRAANLLVTGGMKLVVGDTNPTDYLYINAYVNNGLNDFIALGATSATNGTLRLTWSAMGQRVISVNSGDVLSFKIGLRSGKQAFAVQLTSLKIEEV